MFKVMQQHFKFFFCKYWPDDGLLRPKLVANSRIIIEINLQLCQTKYILISLMYQKMRFGFTKVIFLHSDQHRQVLANQMAILRVVMYQNF